MNKSDFLSLGTTKQLDYINRLEEINRQKQELIEGMQKDYKDIADKFNSKPIKNCHWNHVFFKGRGDRFCGKRGIRLNN